MSTVEQAAKHWSAYSSRPTRRQWWHSDKVVRHVNRMACGKPVSGLAEGDIIRLT
jgi:hypothetical protein